MTYFLDDFIMVLVGGTGMDPLDEFQGGGATFGWKILWIPRVIRSRGNSATGSIAGAGSHAVGDMLNSGWWEEDSGIPSREPGAGGGPGPWIFRRPCPVGRGPCRTSGRKEDFGLGSLRGRGVLGRSCRRANSETRSLARGGGRGFEGHADFHSPSRRLSASHLRPGESVGDRAMVSDSLHLPHCVQ